MDDMYANFEELRSGEPKDAFQVRTEPRSSNVLIMAPHGGTIEPGTCEIAEAIAGPDHSLYIFEGLKRPRKKSLHIASERFNEPCALKLLETADLVVTVHGEKNKHESFVLVGGLHHDMLTKVIERLSAVGFPAKVGTERLAGRHANNICNRGRLRRGVQLEISRKLRDFLMAEPEKLKAFAHAVRAAISEVTTNGP